MKKMLRKTSVLLFAGMALCIGARAQTYCTPTYTYGCTSSDNIQNFVLNGEGSSSINHIASGCSTDGYGNFTTMSVNLLMGNTYSGSVTTNYSASESYRIWIDFNDNGTFESTESVATGGPFGSGTPSTFTMSIPLTVPAGAHRMRVRLAYATTASTIDPCTLYSFGETHDYTANIIAPAPCTGTPTPGTAVAFSTTTVTGYTADVVANGVGLPTTSTTATVDAPGGFYFVSSDYKTTATSAPPTYSLPENGFINVSSLPGLKFKLAAYSGNNSLRLSTSTPGTLTVTTPASATAVYLLATSGSGTGTISATVNFTDATSQTFTGMVISDWYGGTSNVAAMGIGRVGATGGLEGTASDPRLYYVPLSLAAANYSKQVASITITRTAGTGYVNIMGVSMQTPTPEPHPVCGPFSTVLNLLNFPVGASGINFQWEQSSTATGPFVNVTGGSGATTTSYTTPTLTSNTYYRVKVTCSGSGLSAYSDTVAVLLASSIPISTPPASTTVCLGQPLNLTVIAPGATSYQWYKGSTPITGATGATYSVPSAATADAGNYSVQVNGCTMSSPATVAVSLPFPVSLGIDTAICVGDTLTLDAGNPGATYAWSTGDNSQTVSVSSAGSYTVSVTNGACTVLDTIHITTNDYPVVNLGVDTVVCPDMALLLDAGNPGATYAWSTGDASETIVVDATGVYSVAVTVSGCMTMDTITVGNVALPEAGTIVVSGPMPDFMFTASGASGATVMSWNFGDGITAAGEAALHAYTANGVYEVMFIATNACGESDTATTTVSVSGLGIGQISSVNAIRVYPNPTNGLTTLEVKDGIIAAVEVADNLGRILLRSQPNAAKTVIDMKGMAHGIYTLRVHTNKGISTLKLVAGE